MLDTVNSGQTREHARAHTRTHTDLYITYNLIQPHLLSETTVTDMNYFDVVVDNGNKYYLKIKHN